MHTYIWLKLKWIWILNPGYSSLTSFLLQLRQLDLALDAEKKDISPGEFDSRKKRLTNLIDEIRTRLQQEGLQLVLDGGREENPYFLETKQSIDSQCPPPQCAGAKQGTVRFADELVQRIDERSWNRRIIWQRVWEVHFKPEYCTEQSDLWTCVSISYDILEWCDWSTSPHYRAIWAF